MLFSKTLYTWLLFAVCSPLTPPEATQGLLLCIYGLVVHKSLYLLFKSSGTSARSKLRNLMTLCLKCIFLCVLN